MIDAVHKWLRIPYSLHIGQDIRPQTRPVATIVFIHGIANSHATWDSIIKKLDTTNIRIISIDLLGFGSSPKPLWQTYSAATHARSLWVTLRRLRVRSPVLLVGHSLGSLVAIQYASRYKRGVKALLLCSPPFYKPSKLANDVRVALPGQVDDAYHMLYRNSRYRQEIAQRLAMIVKAAKLTSPHFVVSKETMPAIVSSLEMSIENQTSLDDAKKLRIPVHVIYGRLDPFVIKSRIRELKAANPTVTVDIQPVTHEIMGPIFRNAIIKHINSLLKTI